MDFFSSLSLYAPKAHLVMSGELDAFAATRLRDRLEEAVDRGCLCFTVDASAVTFVDAGGLGAFVRLRNSVALYGGSVAVTAASPRFRQIFGVAGLGPAFDLDLLPTPDAVDALVMAFERREGSRSARRRPAPEPFPWRPTGTTAVSAR